jgi:hypothetical protein
VLAIGILALITPMTAATAQESVSLPPLSEAALKFSPGQLISDQLRKHGQFLRLNELLVVDELILKQIKLLRPQEQKRPIVSKDLVCQQVKVLVVNKGKILKELGQATDHTDFAALSRLDLLIELEIVDDLLLVQTDVWDSLNDLAWYCEANVPVPELISEQKGLLTKKKSAILKALMEQ